MTPDGTPDADVDPGPFDLAAGGRAAALCLHGLTGTPYEVRPLAEALAGAGVRALGPVLPGHGSTPAALARTRHTEWVDCARGHLNALRERHDTVFLVGMSMGGLVSLLLASEQKVAGLAVVGTPLRLASRLSHLAGVAKHLVPFARKRAGSDIRDAGARTRHPGYDRTPLASVAELLRLRDRVRAGLAGIRAPILVAHGARDRTAHPASAQMIHDAVESSQRRLLLLDRSGHVVPVDVDGARLAKAVSDFLVPLAGGAR